MWSIFVYLICQLYIFFGELFVIVLGPLVNQVVCFFIAEFVKNSLYILDNNTLSEASLTNIFSQSVVCLLILWALSSTE